MALVINVKSKERPGTSSGRKSGFVCGWLYLEADIPAALPHHLQLDGLAVASLPQFQPHFVIDVKQVMGVIAGVVEHFLRQRPRIATEDTFTNFPQQPHLVCLLCRR